MAYYKKRRRRSGANIAQTIAGILVAFLIIGLLGSLFAPSSETVKDPTEPSGVVDPTDPVVRKITDGLLTETEKAALAALTPDYIKGKVWTVDSFAPYVYDAAYVDIADCFGTYHVNGKGLTNFWIAEALFTWSGTLRVLRSADDPEIDATMSAMMVADSYGGSQFKSYKTFDADFFEVGDLFCAYSVVSEDDGSSSVNRYYTALYQGNGVFLVADQRTGAYEYSLVNDIVGAEWINDFAVYYVLRPSQLAAA